MGILYPDQVFAPRGYHICIAGQPPAPDYIALSDYGLCLNVRLDKTPSALQKAFQTWEMNWGPWPETISVGIT